MNFSGLNKRKRVFFFRAENLESGPFSFFPSARHSSPPLPRCQAGPPCQSRPPSSLSNSVSLLPGPARQPSLLPLAPSAPDRRPSIFTGAGSRPSVTPAPRLLPYGIHSLFSHSFGPCPFLSIGYRSSSDLLTPVTAFRPRIGILGPSYKFHQSPVRFASRVAGELPRTVPVTSG